MKSHTDEHIGLAERVRKKWDVRIKHLAGRRVYIWQFAMQAENRTFGKPRCEIVIYVRVDLHQMRQKENLRAQITYRADQCSFKSLKEIFGILTRWFRIPLVRPIASPIQRNHGT